MVRITLTDLPNDVHCVIFALLSNLLRPADVLPLRSCCRMLRTATRAPLMTLLLRHAAAKLLLDKVRSSCEAASEATEFNWYNEGLRIADLATVNLLVHANALPRLEELNLGGNGFGAEEVHALCEGLGHGALPQLKFLRLHDNQLGAAGAEALGAALGRGALPRLAQLFLWGGRLGDDGC